MLIYGAEVVEGRLTAVLPEEKRVDDILVIRTAVRSEIVRKDIF